MVRKAFLDVVAIVLRFLRRKCWLVAIGTVDVFETHSQCKEQVRVVEAPLEFLVWIANHITLLIA